VAARVWLICSPDLRAPRPIPHAARGLTAVLALAGPAGAVAEEKP
jgi:hypothetical protein